MKSTILYLLLFVGLFFFNACKQETVESAQKLSLDKDFKLIEVKGNYVIKVLNDMVATDILNQEASLQQMNTQKEEYIIIIDEPKQAFITAFTELNGYNIELSTLVNYKTVQLSFLEEAMQLKHKTKPKPLVINQLNVEYLEMDATLPGTEEIASYFIYYIESELNLYTVMAWTLEKKKKIYREKVKKMIQTFNALELNKKS